MDKQNQLLRGIESLSEEQKLQSFAIEELETRLELAGNITGIVTGGVAQIAKRDLGWHQGC